ncbi:unnamed protein product [Parnassius apollo]|uniref:(apollo) hypothetical protein n=1 Tax=Parnassius apollo TaxID=110799 RepID=A0A8S3Y6P4_PARAO|nr:unnamed protein product [Parnassius apollo]
MDTGVGDTTHSYAYDGGRVRRWNVATSPYGHAWLPGDVISTCLDLDKGTLEFYSDDENLDIGPMTTICRYCNALKFKRETAGMCCASGKVKLDPLLTPPLTLKPLFDGSDPDSSHFLQHILEYNNCFRMTSFGANIIREGDFMPTCKGYAPLQAPPTKECARATFLFKSLDAIIDELAHLSDFKPGIVAKSSKAKSESSKVAEEEVAVRIDSSNSVYSSRASPTNVLDVQSPEVKKMSRKAFLMSLARLVVIELGGCLKLSYVVVGELLPRFRGSLGLKSRSINFDQHTEFYTINKKETFRDLSAKLLTQPHPKLCTLLDLLWTFLDESALCDIFEHCVVRECLLFDSVSRDMNFNQQIDCLYVLCGLMQHRETRHHLVKYVFFNKISFDNFLNVKCPDESVLRTIIQKPWWHRPTPVQGETDPRIAADVTEPKTVEYPDAVTNSVDKTDIPLTQSDISLEKQYKDDCEKITKAIAPLENIQRLFNISRNSPAISWCCHARLLTAVLKLWDMENPLGNLNAPPHLPPKTFIDGELDFYNVDRLGGVLPFLVRTLRNDLVDVLGEDNPFIQSFEPNYNRAGGIDAGVSEMAAGSPGLATLPQVISSMARFMHAAMPLIPNRTTGETALALKGTRSLMPGAGAIDIRSAYLRLLDGVLALYHGAAIKHAEKLCELRDSQLDLADCLHDIEQRIATVSLELQTGMDSRKELTDEEKVTKQVLERILKELERSKSVYEEKLESGALQMAWVIGAIWTKQRQQELAKHFAGTLHSLRLSSDPDYANHIEVDSKEILPDKSSLLGAGSYASLQLEYTSSSDQRAKGEETGCLAYQARMHRFFAELEPSLSVTEQNLADRVRYILRSNIFGDAELERLRREAIPSSNGNATAGNAAPLDAQQTAYVDAAVNIPFVANSDDDGIVSHELEKMRSILEESMLETRSMPLENRPRLPRIPLSKRNRAFAGTNISLFQPDITQKLTERIDDLKQKIAAWGKRIRRFSERSRWFNQNRLFQSDQKRLYKSLERLEVCGAGPGPDQADTVAFWRGLWSEPVNHSEGPWMEVVASQSASVTPMDPVTITPEDVAEAFRRAPNWKSPGLDGLHYYWLKGPQSPTSRAVTPLQGSNAQITLSNPNSRQTGFAESLFAFVPEYHVDAMLELCNTLRLYMHPTVPIHQVAEWEELMVSCASFLCAEFADQRIVLASTRESLVQTLASFATQPATMRAIEKVPVKQQMCMVEELVRPYQNRAWAQSNWVLVRFWHGSGFGFRHRQWPHLAAKFGDREPTVNNLGAKVDAGLMSQCFGPCPSEVIQSRIKDYLMANPKEASAFLNSLLSQLNWAFSEFITMMQEMDRVRIDAHLEPRQIKLCATCFDLYHGLARALEMTLYLAPTLLTKPETSDNQNELLLGRTCQVIKSLTVVLV